MPIRILDAATVGRIAAGEVVERPSSVVKELMENALDAGATAITVEIRGGGIEYLRVTDNGCGIEPGQVRLAFENHATSKLQSADQLDDIRTLGFRGEALPSIAAVSRVELTTRARSQETGTKLTVEGGAHLQVREVGCPEGTTFIMKDLFFNLPVRRSFLKRPNYEGGLVGDTVARMLIGNPNTSVRFINNGTTLYHSFGDGSLRHAVFAVYGRETAEQMVEVDMAEGGTRLYGLIGTGSLAKQSRAHQLFFINGRSVRCPMLSHVLENVCRSRVTIGLYPMCALNLVLPPMSIDVNVHPNKLEVRFRDEVMMQTVVEHLMQSAFAGEHVLDFKRETTEKPEVALTTVVREIVRPQEESVPQTEQSAPVKEASGSVSDYLKQVDRALESLSIAEASPVLREFDPSLSAPMKERQTVSLPQDKPEAKTCRTLRPIQEKLKVSESDVPDWRVIGVVFRTYILIESGDALLLIDQHAAHERILFEEYARKLDEGGASQQLMLPVRVRLSSREMAVIMDNMDALTSAGYEIEAFGEHDIQIRAVPMVLEKVDLTPIFTEMAGSLSRLRSAALDTRRSEIMQMACKSAVKGGEALTDSEIHALIDEMLTTGAPPTCPHGRPVVKTLTRRDLEKMFKRIQ